MASPTTIALASPIVNKDDLVLIQSPRPVHLAATRLNHAEWGKKTAVADYLIREHALLSSELTKQAHTSWALMHKDHAEKWAKRVDPIEADDENQPPILAACEAFIRPAVVKLSGSAEVEEQESVMISIGSVFVQAKHRGKGYAQTLMVKLREWMLAQYPQGGFSNLYSDIGPKFYSRLGWQVYPSSSLKCLDVSTTTTTQAADNNSSVQHLDRAAVDAALFALDPMPFGTTKSVVAMPFRPATMDWFIRRSHYYYSLAEFAKPALGLPAHFGARTQDGSGLVIWNHLPEPSTLYLIHLRFDSIATLSALLDASAAEAKRWGLAKLEAYLSVEQEHRLREWEQQGKLGQGWSVVEREQSLSSLMVWKQGGQLVENPSAEWDWVGNERYAWV
ncbi:hypothetical protein BCR44DRAFT_1498965 [Catenaria anguillulae PL171]|uniref:N-acetyltransferase domain-containing protein n=1 Tax=Catenaria anguillulae PL171 TaxID=765915 RepID=A0A1Y2HRX9_9FUNG|nr:hypothetical protein BCR44DRAFT_1498965 [Catenaria anguillulae PL171]